MENIENWMYIDDEMLAQYHINQGFTQNFWKVEGDAEVLVDKWEARFGSRDQPRPLRDRPLTRHNRPRTVPHMPSPSSRILSCDE